MRIAVLSGKGGTGKTFVSVNLASTIPHAVYVDCDAEEPNGHLFFKPEQTQETIVSTMLPQFDVSMCTGCRKCLDFCRFNALAFLQGKPKVFPDVCHACGGCALVCPANAISEVPKEIGKVSSGISGDIPVISGILNTGEVSAVPVIQAALRVAQGKHVVIDSPPGSGCSVMETVSNADYCLLVAEPTAFGFHNFKMVHKLVTLLEKPFGVIINKADTMYAPLETFCQEHSTPILLRILYHNQIAAITARGGVMVQESPIFSQIFQGLWDTMQTEVAS